MDTLSDDVLVLHLIPALVWVNHWDICLYHNPIARNPYEKPILPFARDTAIMKRTWEFEKNGACSRCNVKWFLSFRLVNRRFRDIIPFSVPTRIVFGLTVARRFSPMYDYEALEYVRSQIKDTSVSQFWSELWERAQIPNKPRLFVDFFHLIQFAET